MFRVAVHMVRLGWIRTRLLFLGAVGLTLIACLPLLYETVAYPEPVEPGWRDYFVHLNKGTLPLDMSAIRPADLFTWLLPRFLLALVIAVSLETIHGPYSANSMTRTRSRTSWWAGVWSWMVVGTVAFHLISALAPGLLCLVTGRFSPAGTDIVTNMNLGIDLAGMDDAQIVTLMLLPLIGSLMLGTIQVAVSLLATPLVGLVGTLAVLAASVLGSSWWLIGNYGMLVRTDRCLAGFPTVTTTMLACAAITFAAVAIGMTTFHHQDILPAQTSEG